MNKTEARNFADSWLIDAKALLDASRWRAAYYLCGYSVECALKACVFTYIESTGIIFQDKEYLKKCFTHDVEALIKAAGLEVARGLDIQSNPKRGVNWNVVKDWEVDIRYKDRDQSEAEKLYNAVSDDTNGVLSWIKTQW